MNVKHLENQVFSKHFLDCTFKMVFIRRYTHFDRNSRSGKIVGLGVKHVKTVSKIY